MRLEPNECRVKPMQRSAAVAFDHGYAAVYDLKGRVDLFSPDGMLLYSVTIQVPGAHWANIDNAAVDSDGTAALAARAVVDPGFNRAVGIALFEPHNSETGWD
jgi:hypothetical protein